MKERVTLTLDPQILKQIDNRVNGRTVKNRSHAIELLIAKALGGNVPKKAVILAGGKGTRLRPLTYEIPTALIPVHDRTLTEHIFDLLKSYEIHDVIMAVGHMKEKIKKYIGDGSRFGLRVAYVEERAPLGTAGPLRLAGNLLTETFIVSNCDELKSINIEEMYELHKSAGALTTIALTTADDPIKYGVARLDGSRILEFIEKPKKEDAPSNLINSGFYIIEQEVIEMIPNGKVMLETDIFPMLAKKGKLYGYPFSGQWFDIKTPEKYRKALKHWEGIK